MVVHNQHPSGVPKYGFLKVSRPTLSTSNSGYSLRNCSIKRSVADPWHVGVDPDPIFVIELQDANKKLPYFFKFFCLLLFEGTFTSFFKDKKSKRSHKTLKTVRSKVYFSYYFCLVIEGSGSIPLTNRSGSGRPKNIRIRRIRIRIRIRNTDKKCRYYWIQVHKLQFRGQSNSTRGRSPSSSWIKNGKISFFLLVPVAVIFFRKNNWWTKEC